MKIFYSLVLLIFFFACKPYEYHSDYKRTSDTYKISTIGKTEKYFVLRTFNEKGSALLVIEKKSKQLKGKKLKAGNSYIFKTYSFYDTVAFGPNMCHEVEGIRIWRSTKEADLRFTDRKGNEIIDMDYAPENDLK